MHGRLPGQEAGVRQVQTSSQERNRSGDGVLLQGREKAVQERGKVEEVLGRVEGRVLGRSVLPPEQEDPKNDEEEVPLLASQEVFEEAQEQKLELHCRWETKKC